MWNASMVRRGVMAVVISAAIASVLVVAPKVLENLLLMQVRQVAAGAVVFGWKFMGTSAPVFIQQAPAQEVNRSLKGNKQPLNAAVVGKSRLLVDPSPKQPINTMKSASHLT